MHLPSLIAFVATACLAANSALASSSQCSPKVVALATGIHLNIVGQHSELSAVKKLQSIESQSGESDYQARFELAKGELLSDIAGGINIRKFNQQIIPKNNAANAGLKTYAAAQLTEQSLSESLTGVPKHDKSILATLVSDITTGTALNERNLAAATKGCSLGFTFD